MIQLTITKEAVTDLLTPGINAPTVLNEGLPQNCDLLNVTYDVITGMVTYVFDDDKTELTIAKIKYIITTN